MDLFLIHGNHLFPINYLNKYKKDNIFVLIENYQFCTNKKYHKLKLLLILSSMRSFGDNLREKMNQNPNIYDRIQLINLPLQELKIVTKTVIENITKL